LSIPVSCRGRSCCTSSEWHRSSGGNYEKDCSCNCHGCKAESGKRQLILFYYFHYYTLSKEDNIFCKATLKQYVLLKALYK